MDGRRQWAHSPMRRAWIRCGLRSDGAATVSATSCRAEPRKWSALRERLRGGSPHRVPEQALPIVEREGRTSPRLRVGRGDRLSEDLIVRIRELATP